MSYLCSNLILKNIYTNKFSTDVTVLSAINTVIKAKLSKNAIKKLFILFSHVGNRVQIGTSVMKMLVLKVGPICKMI